MVGGSKTAIQPKFCSSVPEKSSLICGKVLARSFPSEKCREAALQTTAEMKPYA